MFMSGDGTPPYQAMNLTVEDMVRQGSPPVELRDIEFNRFMTQPISLWLTQSFVFRMFFRPIIIFILLLRTLTAKQSCRLPGSSPN